MKNVCRILTSSAFFLLLLFLISQACRKEFEEHYREPESASVKVMKAIRSIPDFSIYVNHLEESGLDSLFVKNQSHTLFIPVNSAFEAEKLSESEINRMLTYSIVNSVILPSQVQNLKRFQTFSGKFTLMERHGEVLQRDGIGISHNGFLYKDGTFYSVDTLIQPRPNLYEFLRESSPVLADYIDATDSLAFDRINSTPVGFDDIGQTIYDSLFYIVNTFERDFFPVSAESRHRTATMILSTGDQYTEALDRMALKLGDPFFTHSDIPEDWQTEVFIPDIFKKGVFMGMRDYDEFKFPLLRNIQGDSVRVDHTKIDEYSRYICSNGIIFLYEQFDVPTKLYIDTLNLEGEKLAVRMGTEWLWAEDVKTSDPQFRPTVITSSEASANRYLSVQLPRGYQTIYSLEFTFPKVFPNTYNFLWRANYRPSGFIRVYFNDELVGAIDNFSFRHPVDGNRPTSTGFNHKVWRNINVTEYGDIRIRFEYASPGSGTTNGLNIDYIMLFPAN